MSGEIDLFFEVNPDTGYSMARHVLSEIATHGVIGAADLGAWVCDDPDGYRMGGLLRRLHRRGWVRSEPVSPGSVKLVWSVTEAGAQELGIELPQPAERPRPRRPRNAFHGGLGPEDYEQAVLAAVVELHRDDLDGAVRREVVELVGKRLWDRLSEPEKAMLGYGERRWAERVRYAHGRLVNKGHLARGPQGVWRITDQGRQRAAAATAERSQTQNEDG